jgi:protein-S-isoprenylcysteine O-methyltransferase Ste14
MGKHVGGMLIMGNARHRSDSLINRSNLRDIVVVLSCILALFYPANDTKIILSLLLLAAGCFLHLLVKGVLIRNTVLCKGGIYRLTRHPYYTSNYLIDLSFCLLSGNSYLLLAYPFLFFWAYGPTLRKEESYLASRYEDYVQYGLETPQVLPDGHALSHWRGFFRGFSIKRITAYELSRVMRFWTIACFMVLLHDVRTEGLAELSPFHASDSDGFAFLILFMSLAFVQFIMSRRAKGLTTRST